MKAKITIAAFFLCVICMGLQAQPLVYNAENTGTACSPPPFPSLSQLPVVKPLPDPFLWSNGSGRSTVFSDWECHRNEFRSKIEHYEIGTKPTKSDLNITASYDTSVLTIKIGRNGKSMTLSCQVSAPSGNGPFPAIIGMNSPTGSMPDSLFTNRNFVKITFSHDQVTSYSTPSVTDPYYQLYPEFNLVNTGQYSAWAWGVSRIIDGLELVQAKLPVNLQKIGVTGCSYAGKMALFSGAFDERVALTIAEESGGGGAPSWRPSQNLEPDGSVEKISNTDYDWFKDSMHIFSGDTVYQLPEDHHELMAMVAPRALFVTGNTDFTWLSNQSNYISSRAAKSIYNTLGISDRFGFYIDGGHGHCAVPSNEIPAIQAFIDKFLIGKTGVNTDTVTVNPFPDVNYIRWYQWWGTNNPVLPALPPTPPAPGIFMEAECATVGANWSVLSDTSASNGKFVMVKNHLTSVPAAPADVAANKVVFPFTVDTAGTYNIQARLNWAGSSDSSYWLKVDNGAYQSISSVSLKNPGFENGLTGWANGFVFGGTISADNNPADAHTGNGCMKTVVSSAYGVQWFVQEQSSTFPTVIGNQYTISYWVRAASPNGVIRLSTGPSSALYQPDISIGTAWQKVSWTITANISATNISFDMGEVANTYYIDDVTISEVNAPGWRWASLNTTALSAGPHTVSIAYKADSVMLDKLAITSTSTTLTGIGPISGNCSAPIAFTTCPNTSLIIARPGYNTYNQEPLSMYIMDTVTGIGYLMNYGPLKDSISHKNIEVNGAGINAVDGFVYAIRDTVNTAGTAAAPMLYRIGSNYANYTLGILPAPALASGDNLAVVNPSAGSFDDQGNYYYIGMSGAYSFIANSFTPSTYYVGKLTNVASLTQGMGMLTPTWTKIDFSNIACGGIKTKLFSAISSASGANAGTGFQDIAYNNLYKSLYAYTSYQSGNGYVGQLLAINPTNGLATCYATMPSFGATNNEVAGIATTASGNLDVFMTSGDMYTATLTGNDFAGTLTKLGASGVPALGIMGSIRGDLASCNVGPSTLPTARTSGFVPPIIVTNLPSGIVAYPNPAQGVTTISVSQPLNNASVRMLGMAGNVISEMNGVYGTTFKVDMTGKPSGMYLIEVIQGGNTQKVKIIK